MKVRSVCLLVFAHAACDLNQGAIPALLPFFIAQHHIGYAAAATIVFATNIVSTASQPIYGLLADRAIHALAYTRGAALCRDRRFAYRYCAEL